MSIRFLQQFKRAAVGIVWLCLFVAFVSHADVPVPALKSAVTDLTATLSPQETASLENTLRSFSAKKGSQLAVLIVPTTAPEAIEQYSMRVVEQWKLGRKQIDDGALLLIAKNDRAVRIEVGYGLEGALTDYTTNRIINELIVPKFKEGHFFQGIESGVAAIIKVVEGEQLPPPTTNTEFSISDYLPFIILGALLLGGLSRSLFGQVVGPFVSAVIAFIIALFFIHILGALLISIITFAISFFGNFTGMGGGGFGGGGRGGSNGSFGGGGGRFGGGGSSGKW